MRFGSFTLKKMNVSMESAMFCENFQNFHNDNGGNLLQILQMAIYYPTNRLSRGFIQNELHVPVSNP